LDGGVRASPFSPSYRFGYYTFGYKKFGSTKRGSDTEQRFSERGMTCQLEEILKKNPLAFD
tara:strand:+ start:2461 stop:2643 length:183 start_codon:yes stop_codon:yes gene_type:complete